MDRFLSTLENAEEKMNAILSAASETGKISIIAMDTSNKLKNHEYDSWYRKYSSEENGIWLGNGINDQYLLNANLPLRERDNNCGMAFAYSINPRRTVEIKVIGMQNAEEGEL